MSNLYEILGVNKSATEDDITKAYRKLARLYHPDRNPGDAEAEAKFKEVASAYEILSNTRKRQEYDLYGQVGRVHQGQPPFSSVVTDFFSTFFNGEQQRMGENIIVYADVTLEQVLKGGTIQLSYQRKTICSHCNGARGAKADCTICEGTGHRIIKGQPFTIKMSCEACNGQGQVLISICEHCDNGFSGQTDELFELQIPMGIEDNSRLTRKEMGQPCADGINGNLHIVIRTEKHGMLERMQKGNVLLRLPLTYAELLLGTEIEIPTLDGRTNLKIPPLTRPGTQFRFKEIGFPRLNQNSRGDQYIQVGIDMPNEISDECKEILNKLLNLDANYSQLRRKQLFGDDNGRT